MACKDVQDAGQWGAGPGRAAGAKMQVGGDGDDNCDSYCNSFEGKQQENELRNLGNCASFRRCQAPAKCDCFYCLV
jgi:hypothetical protein